MIHWINFFTERFHPLFSFFLFVGISLSAAFIGQQPLIPFSFIASTLLLFYIAFLLRLKNDVDDLEKDAVAHPDRCLVRGAISKKEAERAVEYLQYVVFAYLIFLFFFFGMTARFWLIVSAAYLWWRLKSPNKALRGRIWLQIVVNQVLIIPLVFLVIAMNHPSYVFSGEGVCYVFLVFGALFLYEICRKLDPYSHPILLTPTHYYGFQQVYRVALALLGVTALAAYGMGIPGFLWPFELGVFIALSLLFKSPSRFSWAHGAASVSLLVHAWAGVLPSLLSGL